MVMALCCVVLTGLLGFCADALWSVMAGFGLGFCFGWVWLFWCLMVGFLRFGFVCFMVAWFVCFM